MKALKHGLMSLACMLALAACTDQVSSQRLQIEKAEQTLQQNAEEAIALLPHVTEKRSLHRGNMFHCFKYTTRRNKSELNFSRSTNN